MKKSYQPLIASFSLFAVGGALLTASHSWAQEAAQVLEQQQGVQELTRGPVHEAFAATVNFDPQPGVLIGTAPPELIEEIPPDQRPVGTNVAWIPGYWGWDEDASDFIWISGVWRNLPPGRQWVPGYWADAGQEWQWTSGYWADEEVEEVVYLPKPPRSVETGPNIQAPSQNHIWISGTWINREERYAWRPGYWEPAQPNWIWIPAHYRHTPRGYVFVDGYWDYQVARRGVVFAPVRFDRFAYNRPNYYYRPTTVINLAIFTNHLFVRPSYSHYYFGDYYAPRYQDRGFYASFSYHSHRGYDPIYAYERWEHRDDRDWERSRRERFDYYRSNEDARPPHTWVEMRNRAGRDLRGGRREELEFAQPLDSYISRADERQRFETVSVSDHERVVAQRQEMRRYANDRRKMETQVADLAPKDRARATREKISKSPIIGRRAEQFAGAEAPPKRLRDRAERPGASPTDPRPSDAIAETAARVGRKEKGGRQGKIAENDVPLGQSDPATNSGDRVDGIRPGRVDSRDKLPEAKPSPETRVNPKVDQEKKAPKPSLIPGRREAAPRSNEATPQPQDLERRAPDKAKSDQSRRGESPPKRDAIAPTRRAEPQREKMETRQERKVIERKPEAVPQAPRVEPQRKKEAEASKRGMGQREQSFRSARPDEPRVSNRADRQEARAATAPARQQTRELPVRREVERKPARSEALPQARKADERSGPAPITQSLRNKAKSQRPQEEGSEDLRGENRSKR